MDFCRIHILVVDDVADTADSCVELLTLWGYNAVACYDGVSALKSAHARRPDAVLLDLAMPRMDGFQFAGLFHELPECQSVPIIALSGCSSPAYRARAREVGVRHYLLKPADPERLQELLAREFEPAVAPNPLSGPPSSVFWWRSDSPGGGFQGGWKRGQRSARMTKGWVEES